MPRKYEKNFKSMIVNLIVNEKHTTIITTNKPFGPWRELFGNNMIANAILDRLVHHSHIINITGKSYRLKDKIKIDSDTTESIHN